MRLPNVPPYEMAIAKVWQLLLWDQLDESAFFQKASWKDGQKCIRGRGTRACTGPSGQ